ncbi:hypothetical protein [Chryseobacterium schmidteae]|nr:hypothetical protein [Chryseobacterium schmidteae]
MNLTGEIVAILKFLDEEIALDQRNKNAFSGVKNYQNNSYFFMLNN